MTEHYMIPFSNEHFAATLLKLQELGSPYWYGTCMYRCKDSTLRSKTKQYPSHYTDARMDRYREDIAAKCIAADCIGAIKGYCWTNGGEGLIEAFGSSNPFSNKYGTNNCPDKSANGMFEWAKKQGMDWGTIATMPELIGLLVRYDGHVGVYIGDGLVVEWRGFKYGSQITELSKRKWTHWYKHPAISYCEAPDVSVRTELGSRLLKNVDPMMTGDDVEMLQQLLVQLGWELDIDGKFGPDTEKAVQEFQRKNGLDTDGKYGPLTHAALMDAVGDNDAGSSGPEETEDAPAEVPAAKPSVQMVQIVSKGGNVNIRTGNGTEYGRLTSVRPGKSYPYVATAVNGWHAIRVNGQIGWVSGEYSSIVDDNPPEDTPPKDSGKVRAIADISRWQKDIDFAKLQPEVEFVIARGMYGTSKDVYIDRYAAEMARLGIPFGVYQYAVGDTADNARGEARAFHEAMAPKQPLFWVLDAEYEELSADTIRAWADEMRALGAKKLGCYVAHHRYNQYGFDDLRELFDFVWIPRYGANDGSAENSARPAYACDLWQYTSKGRLPGIPGDVDLNLLTGDRTAGYFTEGFNPKA